MTEYFIAETERQKYVLRIYDLFTSCECSEALQFVYTTFKQFLSVFRFKQNYLPFY